MARLKRSLVVVAVLCGWVLLVLALRFMGGKEPALREQEIDVTIVTERVIDMLYGIAPCEGPGGVHRDGIDGLNLVDNIIVTSDID